MLIQWFPGHMKKTKDMIVENLKLVDIVIEIIDARLPISSKNPDVDSLICDKPKIILMNKIDLADEAMTKKWIKFFQKDNVHVLCVNSITGVGIKNVVDECKNVLKYKLEKDKARGRIHRTIRAMIVGIPNVGKSTFINKLVGKGSAKTGDKPGVTKGKQWIKIRGDFELLDTPGILWPKFEDEEVGIKLAAIGSVKEEIIDTNELALNIIRLVREININVLIDRYKIKNVNESSNSEVLEQIAENRKFYIAGGNLDLARASKTLLDEFKGGKLGRITLDIIK
ncbi:MAG: ribosome biogenesis GTPase YlqF [Clostridiales bacterium GWE2_32_10]|nr:MAG: ribosome biogenesis GTPase YlqF [Clostridiales bacterium GWE2_32_10]HBY20215.1 ribosome biogenesis GTPase YlqF [Clostridiales bacterium]